MFVKSASANLPAAMLLPDIAKVLVAAQGVEEAEARKMTLSRATLVSMVTKA